MKRHRVARHKTQDAAGTERGHMGADGGKACKRVRRQRAGAIRDMRVRRSWPNTRVQPGAGRGRADAVGFRARHGKGRGAGA